jgi:hypothetical protein
MFGPLMRGLHWLLAKGPRIAVVSLSALVVAGLVISNLADITAVSPTIGILGLAVMPLLGVGVVLIREEHRRPANQRDRKRIAGGCVLVVFAASVIAPRVWQVVSAPAPTPPSSTAAPGDVACKDVNPGTSPRPFTCAVSLIDGTCAPSGHWLTTKAPAQITTPMPREASEGWRKWDAVSDGVAASPSGFYLTIQGKSEASVVLRTIRAVVTARRPPLKGIDLWRECGGDGAFRGLNVDLDHETPTITDTFYPDDAVGEPPHEVRPIKFPYTVALSDPETFSVSATTNTCDCDWRLEIDWTSQGHAGTVLVGDNGRPFRTSTAVATKSCEVIYGLPSCR